MSDNSCWQTLGIEPTNDEAVIKRAYAKQLKHNKPDKNPDGFRQLRAAYEQALEARYWYDFAEIEEVADTISEDIREDEVAENTQYGSNSIENLDSSSTNEPNVYNDKNSNSQAQQIDNPSSERENNPDSVDSAINSIDTIDDELLIHQHSQYQDDDNDDDNDDKNSEDTSADNDAVIYYQLASNMARWRQAWQQIVDNPVASQVNSNNSIFSSNNSSEQADGRFNHSTDSNMATHPIDQQLQQLLIEQFDVLQQQPLDVQTEFEEDLLSWFSEQPPVFANSYQLAKSHFAWDKHLNEWQRFEYPWFRLADIDRQYQQLANFQTPANWIQYLASYYPSVYNVWNLEIDGQFDAPKRWEYIDVMHFPYRAHAFAIQLEELNNELEFYQQQESDLIAHSSDAAILTASYWREHPQMQALNRWTFGWVIRPRDFIILATISIGILMLIWLLSNSPWQQYFYDGIGVFLTITTTYLFWQFLLALFVRPQRFFHKTYFAYGWLASSIMLYSIFYLLWIQTTADITASDMLYQHTGSYLACNLAGLNLFLASNNQEENIFTTFVSCNFALLLLLSTIILPVATVVISASMQGQVNEDAIAFSPLFWLLPIAPTLLISVGERLTRIHSIFYFIEKIGYMILGGLSTWGLLLLGFILYAYCVDILPDIDFGFTALALIVCFGIPVLVNYFTTLNKHFKT